MRRPPEPEPPSAARGICAHCGMGAIHRWEDAWICEGCLSSMETVVCRASFEEFIEAALAGVLPNKPTLLLGPVEPAP